jgi:DNA-dependent metalloprotease WSS1
MTKRSDTNIKTIADFTRFDENNSPNVRAIPKQSSIATASTNIQFDYSNNNSSKFNPKVYHIPKLHNDVYAKQLLNRVVQEFLPILQRRQYNVRSISELCCCNDGLDFQHEHDLQEANDNNGTKQTTKSKRRRRRKIRKVADNIWGYNRTSFSYGQQREHTIHIRLRHTADHTKFLLYEDVAGTLAHELSHCEFGPHDAKFFKLMDDILEEHANLLYNNNSLHTTMPWTSASTSITPFSGTGHTLGSGVRQTQQQQQHRLGHVVDPTSRNDTSGQVLGGDRTFVQWMSPKDAAVIAAETRRRQQLLRMRGDHDCCRPCYDDDDDDDSDNIDAVRVVDTVLLTAATAVKRSKVPPPQRDHDVETTIAVATKQVAVSEHPKLANFVDLTTEDDDENTYQKNPASDVATAMISQQWSCRCCTYRNQPLSLICDMCSTTRRS